VDNDDDSSTCSTDTTNVSSPSQPADAKGDDDWPFPGDADDSSESSSSSTDDSHILKTEIVVADPTLHKSVQFYQILESAYKTTKLHDRSKTVTSRSSPAYERPKVTKIKGIDPPYEIKIRGEMLGLTVENILENTYIRTVVPSGMAASAGAKVGCVISQIGEARTENLTHFETIEILRSSHRPLLLTLTPTPSNALSEMREYMGKLVNGWALSPAATLFGVNSDVGAKFLSVMSVFLARMEVEAETPEKLASIQQILLEHVISLQPSGIAALSQPSKASTSDTSSNHYDRNAAATNIKINKIPSKKLLKKQLRQTLNKLANNQPPKDGLQKKKNFTQVLTRLSPYWDSFGDLNRDIILLLLNSGEENFKVMFKLVARDLNIPLSVDVLRDENSTEDIMPDFIPQLDDVREVCVSSYLPLVHATSQANLMKRKCCAVLCRLLWSSRDHLADHPDVRLQLRGVLTRLLHDVDSAVRQMTVQTLLYIISTMDHTGVKADDAPLDPTLGWLVTLGHRLFTDPVPELRAKSVLLATEVAEMLPKGASNIESYLLQCKLLPITSRAAEDKSAAVRQTLALYLPRLIAALSPHWVGVLLDVIIALLGDDDQIVKVGVLGTLVDLGPGLLDTILPLITKLVNDDFAGVRCALARTAGQLLIHCHQGNNKELMRHLDATLLPLLQRLLHDSDAQVTSAALRAVSDASNDNALSECDTAKSILTETQVLKLLPTLRHLTMNSMWRVRSSAVEIVPTLLQCTNKLDVRVEIAQLCIGLLGDKVDGVRTMAAECLCGGKVVGSPVVESSQNELADCEWVDLVVLPHLKACSQSLDYRQRLLCFKMICVLLKNSNISFGNSNISPKPRQAILDVMNRLSMDPVPNIRLNVGRTICRCCQNFSPGELALVICILEDVDVREKAKSNGGDRDVLFFTRKGLRLARDLSKAAADFMKEKEAEKGEGATSDPIEVVLADQATVDLQIGEEIFFDASSATEAESKENESISSSPAISSVTEENAPTTCALNEEASQSSEGATIDVGDILDAITEGGKIDAADSQTKDLNLSNGDHVRISNVTIAASSESILMPPSAAITEEVISEENMESHVMTPEQEGKIAEEVEVGVE